MKKLRELIEFVDKYVFHHLNCPFCESNHIKFDGTEDYEKVEGIKGINFVFYCCNCGHSFKISDCEIKKFG